MCLIVDSFRPWWRCLQLLLKCSYLMWKYRILLCNQAGLRQLVSLDLDTEWAEFVQFYLRMGGDWAECNQADSREEGLLLQYSNDGGISWGLIAEMYFTDFTKPRWGHRKLWEHNRISRIILWKKSELFGCRFVHYELPLASKTPCTRFRWWQPLHSGEGYDQWAIDDVIILSEREKHVIPMADPTLPQVTHTTIVSFPVQYYIWDLAPNRRFLNRFSTNSYSLLNRLPVQHLCHCT